MRFFTKVQNVSIYNWCGKIFFNFRILFLTLFCNQKLYFRIISQFYAQILDKNPQKTKNSKNIENYEVFHKSKKSFNMQLGVAKYVFDFLILFLTPFCNQKLYCRVFFHNFMHKFLTKNPKQPTILFFIKPEKKRKRR